MNSAAYVLLVDSGLSLHPPALDLVPAQGSGPERLNLEGAGDPRTAAVKVMTWNAHGMHRTPPGYRLRLRGNGLVLEGKGGIYGLDGRSFLEPTSGPVPRQVTGRESSR